MSEPSSPEEAAKEFVQSLLLDPNPSRPLWDAVAQAFRERDRLIRAEERERCARVADRMANTGGLEGWAGTQIAAAIRAEKIGESEERTSSPNRGVADS